MKKKILFIVSIILIITTVTFAFAGCKASTVVDEKEFKEQEEYYAEVLSSVKKCEPIIAGLVDNLQKTTCHADFLYERKYYSTANDNVLFKGTSQLAGYDNNKKNDGTSWMMDAISYSLDLENGDMRVVAKIHKTVKFDDYNKDKLPEVVAEYVYHIKGEDKIISGASEEEVKKVCYDNILGVITKLAGADYLEAYATSADNGFRLYTTMLQYQLTKAYPYAADGTVDTSKVVNYKENKGKTMHSATTSTYDAQKGGLVFTLDDKEIDIADESVTYWDSYGEDINYNFYKIAEVDNEKVTVTYKKSKSQINSYEYYSERVLPFYTKKDKFNNYFVVKAVVAETVHYIINVDYKNAKGVTGIDKAE